MRLFKSNRGSILLTTLLFAGALAIFLGSYMNISLTALQMSNRSIYSNAATSLVDAGLDQATWAMNNSNWAGFNSYNGNQYQGTFDYSSHLSNGLTGVVKVWANPNGSPAQVVAEATISFPKTIMASGQLVKAAEIYMQPASFFTGGLVAKGPIALSGGTYLDAWNSSVTDAPAGQTAISAPVPYYSSGVYQNNLAQAKICSTSTSADAINGKGGATVCGYASVGGDTSNDIKFTGGANLGPFGYNTGVDPDNVSYNFTASMPDVTAPAIPAGQINADINSLGNSSGYNGLNGGKNMTLPLPGDFSITSNGVTTYYYGVSNLKLGGGSTLTISAKTNVVFLLNDTANDGSSSGNLDGQGNAVAVAGGAKIMIPNSSSVAIYTGGNINLGGGGITNGGGSSPSAMNPAADFQVYGTRSAATAGTGNQQTLTIDGGSGFSGVIYAPNANTTFNGGGDILGAVVCNLATLNGGAHFHYDLALASFGGGSSTNNISKYRELESAGDRALYAAQLNF